MNGPPVLPAVNVNRRLSRSNSTSSSVATVKHLSSKIGYKPGPTQNRPTSSDSIHQHFSTLDAANEQPVSAPMTERDLGRSPNLNINRWSHSTSSSLGAIESTEFLHHVSGNAAQRFLKPSGPVNTPSVPPNPQYSSRQPSESSLNAVSPVRNPATTAWTSHRTSPESARVPFTRQASYDQISSLASTPDPETSQVQLNSSEYFGATTSLVDHSRSSNKYGQQVEGMTLQFTSAHLRQRRSDQNKMGNGLYQATNSSHISLQQKRGHNRRKEKAENGSRDTTAGASISSIRSDHSKKGGHRSPTQKNMLSQALSKANQAVQLDNAQNIQGAIEAYVEACDILEQVMARSHDVEDKKKLSAIRITYSSRIAELYDQDNSFDYLNTDKELPDAPMTTHYLDGHDRISFEDPDDIEPAINFGSAGQSQRAIDIPLRQESLLPQIFGGDGFMMEQQPAVSSLKPVSSGGLTIPMDAKYMPQPLSPRRPPSPTQTDDQPTPTAATRPATDQPTARTSTESMSWLDTKDENNSPIVSSRGSSIDLRPTENELMSAIEADLDAAVDAAYEQTDTRSSHNPQIINATAPAFEADVGVPQTSRDGVQRLAAQQSQEGIPEHARFDHLTLEYLDEEAEEEEALLEMIMEQRYVENQMQNSGTLSSLPRQSDSDTFSARSSGRTWESSATAASQGTALSTLAEGPEVLLHESQPDLSDKRDIELHPRQGVEFTTQKQESALPPLPTTDKLTTVGLRDRRMSGQSAAQLKIETFTRRPSVSQQNQPVQVPLLDIPSGQLLPELARSASGTNLSINTPLASIQSPNSVTDSPGLGQQLSHSISDGEGIARAQDETDQLPPLRPNTSASNLRPRNLSVATNDLNDLPATPGSGLFPTHSRQGTISTPAVSSVSPNVLSSTAVGGMYVFDHITDSNSLRSPQSPDTFGADPLPLELCPESFLLRPFWLMRCLYQTLAHPRGGYLSTKLFVPRDIWRVRGVKLKGIEDKMGQCDTLTAALLKLAKVDTLDADAVLEELQSFDNILENARINLTKKLGNDVGLTGSMTAMKNSPAGEEIESSAGKATSSVKSLASSWRKLRSKSSSAGLSASSAARKENIADLGMSSIPMTPNNAVNTSRSYRTQRHPPPTPSGLPYISPQHVSYMSSLARLFEAVQVLDSIARQVEDPGLKATSKTQVGLELSIRGAAEFFSFYIIRFALADIALLIDKYLKRNGEWAMI